MLENPIFCMKAGVSWNHYEPKKEKCFTMVNQSWLNHVSSKFIILQPFLLLGAQNLFLFLIRPMSCFLLSCILLLYLYINVKSLHLINVVLSCKKALIIKLCSHACVCVCVKRWCVWGVPRTYFISQNSDALVIWIWRMYANYYS